MGKRHPNHRHVKGHRSYTVEEIAGLFNIHKNTVREWVKAGLPTSDDRRPMLILGHELIAFLQARRVTMQLFSAAPLFSPISHVETLRSSCGLPPTWCASQESEPLFSLSPLVVILYEPLPISPVAPVPSCAVKPPILFGSVGSSAEIFSTHLMTR
jgi:hypothetical protein